MMSLTFAEFYRALWSRDPFPWQERLATVVAERGWPAALDIPTGCGKTTTIDIALWHLVTAPDGEAPRRIVYVVDRRLVVDGTAMHARAIADALAAAAADSVLGRVAQRLRTLAGHDEALRVVTLRGGVPRDHSWAGHPPQPLVVLSTVDQVGSRLLFRGYGVSSSMRPVHAALLANDALLLLDEAHLSEPFRQTLHALVPHMVQASRPAAVAPLQAVLLSATLPGGLDERFTLSDDDHRAPALAARLGVSKRARLVAVADEDHQFANRMLQEVQACLAAGARTVLVVANRVASARLIFDGVHRGIGNHQVDAELLIGPSRSVVRDARTRLWFDRVKAGRDRARAELPDRPFVLVATQCVEAGVDFDVDALITESAPLDALRQRFGRLDRLGQAPNPDRVRAAVVHRQRRSSDPVYGDRIAHTWEWLSRSVDRSAEAADHGARSAKSPPIVDFGLEAMRERLRHLTAQEFDLLLSERPNAPRLLPHHLEAWSDTSDGSDLPVPSLFLHGPRAMSSVRIGWRADLEHLNHGVVELVANDEASAALSLVPPSPGELIEVSIASVRRWLDGKAHLEADLEADVPVVATEEAGNARSVPASARRLFRERHDGSWEPVDAARIRPGDLLMAPASLGGCDEYGWSPGFTGPVTDVAEDAHEQFRGEWVRRVHQRQHAAAWTRAQGPAAEGLSEDELIDMLRTAVPALAMPAATPISLTWYRPERTEAGFVLRARTADRRRAFEPESTASDEGSFAHSPITLEAHARDVEQWTDRFAAGLEVRAPERRALHLAARWHDVGKTDPAFQGMLRGEGTLSRFDRRPLLAKSGAPSWSGRRPSSLPRGWRHEVLSTVMAERVLMTEPPEVRDLALWLIATHHGRGRLFFDEVSATPSLRQTHTVLGETLVRDAGVTPNTIMAAHAERGERLSARYGAYGLAFLEAILRLADHRASAFPDTPGGVS